LRYIFGGAITVEGLPYVDFLVPGSSPPLSCSRAWEQRPGWPRTSNRASSTGSVPCRSPARR
jgi:hypothetical protein